MDYLVRQRLNPYFPGSIFLILLVALTLQSTAMSLNPYFPGSIFLIKPSRGSDVTVFCNESQSLFSWIHISHDGKYEYEIIIGCGESQSLFSWIHSSHTMYGMAKRSAKTSSQSLFSWIHSSHMTSSRPQTTLLARVSILIFLDP